MDDKIKEIEDLKAQLIVKNREIDDLYELLERSIEPKGARCSLNGKLYERAVHSIIKNYSINGTPFNTQNENELGGSSSKNDIQCNFNKPYDTGIEIKKCKSPDWMQCVINLDNDKKIWKPSTGKNPKACTDIFRELINGLILYNGDVPPFVNKDFTHDEWIQEKNQTDKWNDVYFDIPSDTIRKLYSAKGCQYIQIEGFGLYHLGNDYCGFHVPIFELPQQLRIRTKIHKKKNSKGFCKPSVTMACQPKNIKDLAPSKYSLDHIGKLPLNLDKMN